MLKFYRIFCIAWKFLAKFVELCLKKLYYTAFFSKIFHQYFSARFFGKIFRQDFSARFFGKIFCYDSTLFNGKRQHFSHRLAFFVGICRRMTKNAVIWQRFLILFDIFQGWELCRKMMGRDVCRMMLSSWCVDS